MTLRSTLSVLALACSSLPAIGCAADSTPDPTPSTGGHVALEGNIGGGATATRTFGAITTARGNLHVTAREVHVRGTDGRSVDVAVAPDGSFRVDIARGSRWLVTVDDADGNSAIVTFGTGQNVLRVSADGTSSRVDIGGLQVIGGQAQSKVMLDGRLGIEATLAGLDDVFEAADGVVIAAQEAAAQAQRAAEQAQAAADDALASAEAAQQAAEAAGRNAGL